MKKLILALSIIAPMAAHATNVNCESAYLGRKLSINIESSDRISDLKSKVNIHSQGRVSLVFHTVVDSVEANSDERLAVTLTTLNDQGEVGQESGVAKIALELQASEDGRAHSARGTGTIDLLKKPPTEEPIRLLQHYDLTNCKGSI